MSNSSAQSHLEHAEMLYLEKCPHHLYQIDTELFCNYLDYEDKEGPLHNWNNLTVDTTVYIALLVAAIVGEI